MPECDTRIRPAGGPLIDARTSINTLIVRALTTAQAQPNADSRVDKVYELLGAPISTNRQCQQLCKPGRRLPATVLFEGVQEPR